jgi:hypothetical protein
MTAGTKEQEAGHGKPQRSALSLFGGAVRAAPVRTVLFLVVEYLMFFSAVFLAVSLFVTRVPLRVLDSTLGLSLRQRFVDFIARLSPG